MKIRIKNNRTREVSNADLIKCAEYYLGQLMSDVDLSELSIDIGFKKLVQYRGGYVRTMGRNPKCFIIAVNSQNSLQAQLSTLAHECVHVKQYFTKELEQVIEFSNRGRAKHIHIWKGKRYARKKYWDRPWEKEARKFQDKLSSNVLNKINKPKAKAEPKPVEIIPQAVCDIEAKVLAVVNVNNIQNGLLVGQVLQGSTDKQYRIRVLKKVFELKQKGVLKEYNVNGLVWVGLTHNLAPQF